MCSSLRFSTEGWRADTRRRFTLLNFGAAAAAGAVPSGLRTLHVVRQPIGPDDIADTEGHLADAYGATGRTLVLIRPDGYIAMISDVGDVSAVSRYLTAIGLSLAPAGLTKSRTARLPSRSRLTMDLTAARSAGDSFDR